MMQKELEVIKKAIINEVEGNEFYKMAAAQAKTPESKEAFMQLAHEEEMHIKWLKEMFGKVEKGQQDAYEFDFEKYEQFRDENSPGIFKKGVKALDTSSLSVAVYGIGIEMERSSVEFYQKLASETTIPKLKSLCEKLAFWERVHMNEFKAQYDLMMGDWWNDQEFAPF